jgi:DNA polymerase (family 10)
MTNQEMAQHLRELQAYLVIAGYDEVHARRYLHISHEIEQMGEPIEQLRREGRLKEIQGVGPSIAGYLKEILDEGKCSKQVDWEKTVPFTVIDLLKIPALGARTAQRLLHDYGVFSLEALIAAIDGGLLDNAPGIGDKTLRHWRENAVRLLDGKAKV